MGRQHLTFGITTGIVAAFTCYTLGIEEFGKEAVTFVTFSGLGSLLPDIDSPKSTIGRCVYPISWLINKLFGHRTITHDIVTISLIALLTIFMNPSIALYGFWLGYLGHLFLDSFNYRGVAALYPINKKNFHIVPVSMRMNSDSDKARTLTTVFSISSIIICGFILTKLGYISL